MSKLLVFSLVIFTVLRESHLQVSKMGTCPKDIKPMTKFNAESFKGLWYEIKRYPTVMVMGKCVSINFITSNSISKIVSSQIMPGLNTTTSASGVAEFYKMRGKNDSASASWGYKITLGLLSSNATFTIIDTDNKNWAALYSCGDFFGYSSLEFAWIYSRNRSLSETSLAAAVDAFQKQKIDTMPLILSDQKDCVAEDPKKDNSKPKKP